MKFPFGVSARQTMTVSVALLHIYPGRSATRRSSGRAYARVVWRINAPKLPSGLPFSIACWRPDNQNPSAVSKKSHRGKSVMHQLVHRLSMHHIWTLSVCQANIDDEQKGKIAAIYPDFI